MAFWTGTLMQLIVVIIVVMAYIVVLTHFKPYTCPRDDFLAISNQIMLFLTLVSRNQIILNILSNTHFGCTRQIGALVSFWLLIIMSFVV